MRWTKKPGWFSEIVSLPWTVGCYLHGMETSVVCTRLGEIRNRHGINRHTTMHTKYYKINIIYIYRYGFCLKIEYIPKFMLFQWIFHIYIYIIIILLIYLYISLSNGYFRIGPAIVTTPRARTWSHSFRPWWTLPPPSTRPTTVWRSLWDFTASRYR